MPAAATAWPKKLPEQIAAIRGLVARTHDAWTIEKVCTAFKGAKKIDVEEVLESLEALGLLTGYTHKSTRLWKAAHWVGRKIRVGFRPLGESTWA